MGRSTAFAVLTTAVLLLTGCAAAPSPDTPPSTSAAPPPPTGPLTLREALGDPATVDFCDLLDFSEIEKTSPPLSEPTLSMGACSFQTRITGSAALFSFGFPDARAKERLAAATPVTEPSLPRGLRVVRSDLQGQPLLHLIFTDDSSLRIGTFFENREAAGPEVLAVAAKILDGVARSLATGKQARHLEYRDGSLARLDACSALLSGTEVSARLGVTVSGKGDLSGHQCLWGDQGAPRLVRMEFGLGPHPKAAGGVQEERLGGRRSFVQEVSGGCTVLTSHIGGPDPERNQVEHAILAVQAPDACRVARELAAIAWPKLPV